MACRFVRSWNCGDSCSKSMKRGLFFTCFGGGVRGQTVERLGRHCSRGDVGGGVGGPSVADSGRLSCGLDAGWGDFVPSTPPI
jgi:hypothetical protein